MTTFYEELERKKGMRDEVEDGQSRAVVDKWIFRLMLLLIGVMPLLVFGHIEDIISPLLSNIELLSSGTKGELFTHYKAVFVVIITIITGAMLLAKVFFMSGSIKKTWLNYVLGAFVIAIIASTIFSPNITVALNGIYNRSDGAISWLCYIALMFIAMNIEYPKNVVQYIMYSLIPFVYINLYIITMNFYGKDLLQNEVVSRMVMSTLPGGANIGENSQLVGTLNQWNYMSGMFAMMAVFYLAWAIVNTKLVNNIIGIVTAVASLAVMLMSLSTSGFLTILVTFLLVLLLVIKVANKKRAIGVLVSFIILGGIAFHTLASENENIWNESFGFILNSNPYKEEASVTYNTNLFSPKVYASDEVFELPVLPEAGWAPGTGRLYIWEKTINLVQNRPFLGYGLDTLMYNFPHYNIDARGGNHSEKTIVDKPHNMYLGVLYGTGIIGGVALLLIVLSVTIGALKETIIKNRLEIGSLMCAIVAFAIQALFNDSLPGMQPIFFVLMGIVVAMQYSEIVKDKV